MKMRTEQIVRRQLRQRGFTLRKCRIKLNPIIAGTYQVVNERNHLVLGNVWQQGYGETLEDIGELLDNPNSVFNKD